MKKNLAYHVHTEMSNISCGFRDSLNKVEELLDYALERGFSGVTITDHEAVSAHFRANAWYENKMKEDENFQDKFKVLLGNEIYIAREGLTRETHQAGEKFYHFVLVALDAVGQQQLRTLSTLAWKKGYKYRVPRRYNTMNELKEIIGSNPGHVVASTACLANIAAKLFEDGGDNTEGKIRNYLSFMESVFGKGNFFIEISPALYQQQIDYNKYMVETFKDEYPFIVGVDAHYLNEDEFDVFEILLKSNRMGGSAAKEVYQYAYMMEWNEVEDNLNYLDSDFIEQARLNGLSLIDRASYYSLYNPIEVPKVDLVEHEAEEDLISKIKSYEFTEKYWNSEHYSDRVLIQKIAANMRDLIPEEDIDRTIKRVNLELSELWGISDILHIRVSDYLLTMSRIVEIIWNEVNTIVGPGRGSAVAWVTNYLLGITQVNPLEYPLEINHWRFLSAERPELPDRWSLVGAILLENNVNA